MKYEYDMLVIGGGAAGLTAAGMSALLGAKTALIEQHRLGGDCTWVGCIPSKTLLRAAKAAQQMRTAERFGLTSSELRIDFARLMDHVRKTRQHVYDDADAPPHMEKLGVEVISAFARFTGPHMLELIEGKVVRNVTSRYFVICTGSRPVQPRFAEAVLTNETLFELTVQPERLLILGAGPVGIEMCQAFQRLGSRVTVVAPGKQILSHDDPDHARALQSILAREGVTLLLGEKAVRLERNNSQLNATLESGHEIASDAVLAAIGREPATGALQLKKAGVAFTKQGITVDDRLRTSQAHIYAAGDVTGQHQFTHMAEHMSKVAVTNALLRWPMKIDARHAVWATFTEPELAHLGQSEAQLRERGEPFETIRFPFSRLDRAVTDSETEGEVKVFANQRGKILGVSILGANAGEMISEYALAMRHGLSLARVADTIHPYPTYLLGNRRAADQFTARQLDSPMLPLLGKLFGYRGQCAGSQPLRVKPQ